MNVYTMKYPSYWLGGYAVVVAPDAETAVRLLIAKAKKEGVKVTLPTVRVEMLPTTEPTVRILFNGDY